MIYDHSKFFYGFVVDQLNQYLPFDEGSGEIIAQVTKKSYAPTKGLFACAAAMNDVGAQSYSITMDRLTRLVTISADNPFDLPVASTTITNNIFSLLGFTGADRTGSNIYTGDTPIATEYATQFWLQSYVPSSINKKSIDPTVKKTSSGAVEVVRFGTEQFVEMDLQYITSKRISSDGYVIRHNPTGLEDAIALMEHLISKAEVEFMPSESDPNTYQYLILERTKEDSKGMGYSLDELYTKNLPDVYKTGLLVFRVVE